MTFKKITHAVLALSVLAGLATSCGTNATLPLASGLNQDIFSILADDTATPSADMQARIDQFKAENPELAAALEVLKDLSPEERQAKMQEIKTNYADLFAGFNHGGHMMMGRPGAGHMPGKGFQGQPGAQWGGGMRPDISAFKSLSPEEMKAKGEELKAKFAEEHPELAAAFEGFQDLSPEERKAKIEELKASNPELFEGFNPGGPGAMGHPGYGPKFGKGFSHPGGWGNGARPDFAAFKDMTPEERQAKFEEMRAAQANQ